MANEGKKAVGPPVMDASQKEIIERLSRAREAQRQWQRYTLSQRVDSLRGLWQVLQDNRDELVNVIREETGKPIAEIQAMEIDGAELIHKYFTRNVHRVLQDKAAAKPWILLNKRAYVRHVPRGLIGLITPWNMPFLIPFGDMIPALLAGNGVVIKPSEWTTRVVTYLEQRFNASGLFPEGLMTVIEGGGAVGQQIIDEVDMVVFTGSTNTGRKVAAAAGERLVPCVLELGGHHPMIVAKDAPLERAVRAAVWGRFANSGQICVGVEKVLVEEPVYKEFTKRLVTAVSELRQGTDLGYDADLGRLIYPGQLDVVEKHLKDAKEKGARVIGGEVLDRDGLVVSPALVLEATSDMLVMQEETFGPVLAVAPVARIEEAIRLANEGRHGLAASVWTSDLAQGEDWASLIEAGLLSVNDVLSHYVFCSLPFGGVKDSGLGRRHSDEGLRMFCQEQSVIVHEWPKDVPEFWWFPYSRFKSKLLSFLTKLT
jgi:acyl-CoA reductase-like NAD-dependent aldehyde dehydrogenase